MSYARPRARSRSPIGLMRTVQSELRLEISGAEELKKLRMHGKKCAGMGFVLEQLSAAKLPKDAALVPEHAASIIFKLRQKGIGAGERCVPLPEFAQRALDALKEKRPAPAAAAAAAAPAVATGTA